MPPSGEQQKAQADLDSLPRRPFSCYRRHCPERASAGNQQTTRSAPVVQGLTVENLLMRKISPWTKKYLRTFDENKRETSAGHTWLSYVDRAWRPTRCEWSPGVARFNPLTVFLYLLRRWAKAKPLRAPLLQGGLGEEKETGPQPGQLSDHQERAEPWFSLWKHTTTQWEMTLAWPWYSRISCGSCLDTVDSTLALKSSSSSCTRYHWLAVCLWKINLVSL